MWGADAFMARILIPHQEQGFLQIWRCFVLYQDASGCPRIVIIDLLSLLSLTSFGRSIYFRTPAFKLLIETWCRGVSRRRDVHIRAYRRLHSIHFTPHSRQYHTRNNLLSALIVFRLVFHRGCVRNALGAEHGSLYTNIITTCIESSASMVIASGLCSMLYFVSPNGEIS
jgi:hypothetical protein